MENLISSGDRVEVEEGWIVQKINDLVRVVGS